MPQSRMVNNLIPIDENMTLESIMGNPTSQQMNQNDKLYEMLSESVRKLNREETNANTKKKVRAKAPKAPKAPKSQATALPNIAPAKAPIDKEMLIMKIQKYQASRRFGNYITKDLKITQSREQLNKCSVDKLNGILHRIRLNLNNRNMDAIMETMAVTCAKGYENVVSNFYDIEGFTDLLTQNPGFWDAFERWKIEREMPDIPPGIQLAYIIATTTLAAHTMNAGKSVKEAETTETRSDATEKNNTNNDIIIKDNDDIFEIGKKI